MAEPEFNGFELNVNELLAGKVAEMAVEKIPKEDIENMVDRILTKYQFGSKKYHGYDLAQFEKIVLDNFYRLIGKSIQEFVDSDEKIKHESDEIARRIVLNARESAEKYLT